MRAAWVFWCLLAGCGDIAAIDRGRELFDDPALSTASSNEFSCRTCHDTEPVASRILPGYSLYDSAGRDSYWGGFERSLLSATNQCVTAFMRGRALTDDEEIGRALFVYLRSISPSAMRPVLPMTIVRNISDVPSSDAARGALLFGSACASCHGEAGSGEGRLSSRIAILPGDTIKSFGTDKARGARPITIEKVRHGKYFSVGGSMPLFSLEAMPDDQLGAVLAYLETVGLPGSQ